MEQRVKEILDYWFGNVEHTVLPSENRTQVWFGDSSAVDKEIKVKFADDIQSAINDDYAAWEGTARGSLALIILLDQFPRHVYRDTPKAYAQDQKSLDLCFTGIQKQFDHELSLIERVFFYFPLMHSEDIRIQSTSLRAFQTLVELSFPETRGIFDNFYDYAKRRNDIISRYKRFPQRNEILGRESTPEELEFLKREG